MTPEIRAKIEKWIKDLDTALEGCEEDNHEFDCQCYSYLHVAEEMEKYLKTYTHPTK